LSRMLCPGFAGLLIVKFRKPGRKGWNSSIKYSVSLPDKLFMKGLN
jgi:hypothetical protein